jgi:hypothetical protein
MLLRQGEKQLDSRRLYLYLMPHAALELLE